MRFFLLIKIIMCLLLNEAYSFDTKAKQAVLVDYETGETLLDKEGDQKMYPSSMSKLMTILIIFEKLKDGSLKLEDKFLVSENAWQKQGSKMFVELGNFISVENLLKGIVVQSGNDACIVVAEAISGNEEKFSELMNEKAQIIGLKDSNFSNSTGWPDDNHYMSSKDLVILTKYLIKNFPEYYHYFAMTDFSYNNIKQGNRNSLLSNKLGLNVDGLKTGSTDLGGYGIVASAYQGERRLILVINGLKSMSERAEEAKKLLTYGMNNFSNVTLFKKGEIVAKQKILFGKKNILDLIAEENITVTVKKGQEKNIVHQIKMFSNEAPIIKNSIIGEIEIRNNEKILKSFKLKAGEDIEKISYIRVMVRKLLAKIFDRI